MQQFIWQPTCTVPLLKTADDDLADNSKILSRGPATPALPQQQVLNPGRLRHLAGQTQLKTDDGASAVVTGAELLQTATTVVHRVDDGNFEQVVINGGFEAWLLMFGENCPICQKAVPILDAVNKRLERFKQAGGEGTVAIGTLHVHNAFDTFERFWVTTVPTLKLILPRKNMHFDFVGQANSGGLCCLLPAGCNDTRTFNSCFIGMPEALTEFVLNLNQNRSGVRSATQPLNQLSHVGTFGHSLSNHPLLRQLSVVQENLVTRLGVPILGAVLLLVVCLVAVMLRIFHYEIAQSDAGGQRRQRAPAQEKQE